MLRKLASSLTVLFFLLAAGSAFAKGGKVSAKKHVNLAAAQRLMQQAIKKLSAAQTANEFDMDGHAQKAKDLLEQAFSEAKEAATAANKNKGEIKEKKEEGGSQ
jgi:hypothetical protein